MKWASTRLCLVLVSTLAATGVGRAQNIGGIMGAMMEQAIRAQQQQRYYEQQQRAQDAQRRARAEEQRAERKANQARRDEQRRQEAARAAEQKKLEAERAQAEKAAAAKQAQLAKIRPVARQLVEEGAEFLRRNPDAPQLLELAESVRTLNKLLNEGDPDAIEQKSAALSGDLRKDPAYIAFSTRLADERKERNAKFLADAMSLAGRQKQFLLRQIARDPTSAASGAFATLVKQLTSVIDRPNLDEIAGLTTQADLRIREAGLASQFQQFAFAAPVAADDAPKAGPIQLIASKSQNSAKTGEVEARPAPAPPIQPAPKDQNLTLATTDRNRFVLEGDLNDVVLLYNTSSRAPHVLKNLRGDLIFEGGLADVCAFQSVRDKDDEALARRQLQKFKPERIHYAQQACPGDSVLNYDVVMLRRGQFLASRPQYALSLIKEIEVDNFKQLETLKSDELKAGADADRAKAMEIETDVEKGGRDGYGFLRIEQSNANVCALMGDKVEGQRRVLMSMADNLSRFVGSNATVVASSLDGAFANSKRGQCGAVYASAKDLKDLMAGLRRDGVAFTVASTWIETADIDAADARARRETEAAEQQAVERKRKTDEQRKLAAIRNAELASTRSAQEAALRSKYEKAATAAAATISAEVKDYIAQKAPNIGARYPAFAAWYGAKLDDRWEVMEFNSELADFGQANWKGRMLEAAFSRVSLRLKNRLLGDYEDACFVFGRINDGEFAMLRDPFEATCDDAETTLGWKRGHAFASNWIVDE